MQFCPSYHIVSRMREGMTPMEAAEYALRVAQQQNGGELDFDMTLVALSSRVRTLCAVQVNYSSMFSTARLHPPRET